MPRLSDQPPQPPPASGRRRRALIAAAAAFGLAAWFGGRAYLRSAERADALVEAKTDPGKALPALHRCLARDPADADVLLAVITAMSATAAHAPEVEPYLDRLCAARPDDPAPLRMRIDMRGRFGRFDEALADARRVLALDPQDHHTRRAACRFAISLGRYDEAERDLALLLDASPLPRNDLGTLLARTHLGRGDRAAARAALDRYAPAGDDYPPAQIIRGSVLSEDGRTAEAVPMLTAAAERAGPEDRPNALYHLALALGRAGREDESRRTFDRLEAEYRAARLATDARQRADDMPAQVRAAQAGLSAGNPEAARQILERAVARLGDAPDALRLLAECYDKLGRADLAAAARQRAGSRPEGR
jgi:predicted Zn-dependent protease